MEEPQKLLSIIRNATDQAEGATNDENLEAVQQLLDKHDIWCHPLFPSYMYSNMILFILFAYQRAGKHPDALHFLDTEYDNYAHFCQYEYAAKSNIFEIWAKLLYITGHGDNELLEKLKLSVYYIFIDNTSYDNFEYFSFRCFPEIGTSVDKQFSLNDIRNNTLSFASPSEFNDPMDTILFRWNEYRKNNAVSKEDAHIFELYAQAIEPLKVRCFVRNEALPRDLTPSEMLNFTPHKQQNIEDINSLMWAHYTNSHKGFCVKYKFPSSFVMNNDNTTLVFSRIGNADYQPSMNFVETKSLSVFKALFQKHNVWEYEKEVRIVHYDPSVDSKFKTLQLPDDSIKEIYLGLKCTKDNEELMCEAIEGKNIPLYRMTTKDNDVYHLVAERIN